MPGDVRGVLPGVLLIALGMAGAVAPLTTAVLSSVDDRHMGTASGFNSAIARLHEGITAAGVDIPTDWAYLALAHARKGDFAETRRSLERLRAASPDPSATFWDLQELALLQCEAESLLFDAEFPGDPFVEAGTISGDGS